MLQDVLPEDLSRDERVGAAANTLAVSFGLTQREGEVLRLLVASLPLADIATELGISAKTVQNHVSNIYAKLGVHSLREVMRLLGE